MAHEDFQHRGKTYRIIWEEPTLSHPEVAVVAVFELKNPGHEKIWEQTGDKDDLGWLRQEAHKQIEKR